MLRIISAAVAAILIATPALAQDEMCPEAGVIPWLGGMVLEQRAALPKLQARRYGADAAYLTVRYSPSLSPESIEAFLTPLADEDIRGIKDVVFAWTVVNKGLAATAATLGGAEAEALLLASPTTVRALVAFGAEDVVMNAFGALNDEAAPAEVGAIYTALIDLPDARKSEIAALAEQRGHFAVAGAIYATMRDAAAWPAFLTRLPSGLVEPIGNMYSYFPLYVGNETVAQPGDSNAGLTKELHELVAAAALQPEIDFLNSYFNQTGYIDSALAAARALREAVAAGQIAYDGTMDAGWLLVYRAIEAAGAEPAAAIGPMLQSLTIGQRPLRKTAAEVLNWMLAIEALEPYLRKEIETPPPVPSGPDGALVAEWPAWLALAEVVRNDPHNVVPGGDDTSLAMAAELLFAAGEYQTMAAMLGSMPPSPTNVGLAEDLARRLDRQCESFLWHPAESLVLAGTSIYKFDDLGRDFAPVLLEATPALSEPAPAAPASDKGGLKN